MAQRLNPNARAFSFNPGASEWAPGGGQPQVVSVLQNPAKQANSNSNTNSEGLNNPPRRIQRENLPVPTKGETPLPRENLPVPTQNLPQKVSTPAQAQAQPKQKTEKQAEKPKQQEKPKEAEKPKETEKPKEAQKEKPAKVEKPKEKERGWDEEEEAPAVQVHIAPKESPKPQVSETEAKAETPKEESKATPKAQSDVIDPTDEELAAELALLEAEEAAEAAQEEEEANLEQEADAAEAAATGAVQTKSKKKKEDLKVHDSREHLNIVFIGHVDAGKSTISGQILLLTNQVDERTMAKYEKEAKEKNRESWYLAYVMDTNEEERAKGKTVEVGRAHFATANKRFTLLDAPGHKNFVPNMIEGTAQADIGVLVISARKGEFETGFERGGQTREHAMLAKTLGIQRLVILVNKMDDKSAVNKEGCWDKARFDAIESKMTPFLKTWGYNVKNDVNFVPVSGLTGANIRDRVSREVCPWYEGGSFMELLDEFPPLKRTPEGELRIPIVARYKDMGAVCILGKIESGTIKTGDKLVMMPGKIQLTCLGLIIDDQECDMAVPGENIVVKVKGCEEEDVHTGMVISHSNKPSSTTLEFIGQIWVLDLLEHRPLIIAGYSAVLHTHSLSVECVITQLVSQLDKKTNQMEPKRPRYLKSQSVGNVKITVEQSIAIETFKDFPQMGRFTLRDEGKTIAIGKTLKLLEPK